MDVPQDVVLPQETVALSGSREGQESSRKVQIVIHCHPHSSAEAPAAGQLLGGKEIVPEFHRKYLSSFF